MFKVDEKSILRAPSDDTIQSEEKFYRIKFPSSYIFFIKKYNGCTPITNTFEVGNNKHVLERFVCILGDNRDCFEQSWSDIGVVIEPLYECLTEDGDKLGITLIPIGILFFGNLLCLDFRISLDEPEICIWYHEDSEEFKPVTSKIADNFEQFIDMLK